MIIEHQESKKLIEDTFRNYGKVSKYNIQIDKEQLRSAWTPVKNDAEAFQVFDAMGKECFLYYDEMDNYYRMMLVHNEAVLERAHLSDLVQGVDLPEVGHIYQREREQEALRKELAERQRVQHAAAVEKSLAYFRQSWDECFAINLQFGNIYDISEDREEYAQTRTQGLIGEKGVYFSGPAEGEDAVGLTTSLREYEELVGHPFVASLDHEATPRERLRDLSGQLRKGIFLAKHGFVPSVKENKEFESESEAMLTFTLSNAQGELLVEIGVLFPESAEFHDCMAEPLVVEIRDHSTGEVLEYEDEVAEHPILDSFMGYVADHYDGVEWVLPDGEPTPIRAGRRDDDFVDFRSFDETLDEMDMLKHMAETAGLDEAVAEIAERMDRKPGNSMSFSP